MLNTKPKMHILMCMLVFLWGSDYIVAKLALDLLDPLSLLFFKYAAGLLLVLAIKIKTDGGKFVRKKDIPLYIACVLVGDIGYFYCEYTAMEYLPVSLISIIVAFVPAVSVIIERVLYKRKASPKLVLWIFICILGVALIIGVDYEAVLSGRLAGYLLSFACIFAWNAYNFITASLHEHYTTATLTANQLIFTLLLLLPYMIHRAPTLPEFTPALTFQVLYIGIVISGICFLIVVRALHILGPTTTAVYSNFMPLTTTFLGWLVLGEMILPLQMVGGAIVILAGYIVIREKGRLEELAEITN